VTHEPSADSASQREYVGTELDATAHALNYNRWILRALRDHVGHVIAEVGSGRGSFTAELLKTNPTRLIAIEPAPRLFATLGARFRSNASVELHNAALNEVVADLRQSVDSVVYVNVLEHIADDHAELAAAHDVLKPSGKLCIFVPALPWLMSRFDANVGHQRRYTLRALRTLVEQSSFEIIEARYFDLFGVLTWLFAFKLLGMDMGKARVQVYDRFAVPLARVLDKLTGPPVGKSLLLIARKRA
jgi:SAM-dependent methyltransferase